MCDVCLIFKQLQQQFQRDDLILPDVFICRDAALRKFTFMLQMPFPGGAEGKLGIGNNY